MATVQVCPNRACRTENPADHAYCYACGTQLAGTNPRQVAVMWRRRWFLVLAILLLLAGYAVLTERLPW